MESIETALQGVAPPKLGRPTIERSQAIADEICMMIQEGKTITAICKEKGFSYNALSYWLEEDTSFAKRLARAREDQAEHFADEIVTLSDEQPRMIERPNGEKVIDNAWVTWQKNRIDTRKWIAAKLKPKTYGDRITVDGMSTTNNTLAINMTTEQLSGELMKLAGSKQLPPGVRMLEDGKLEVDGDYQAVEVDKK